MLESSQLAEIPESQLKMLKKHAELVLETNQQFNLTAMKSTEEILHKLSFPSWKLGQIANLQGKTVLDLGTGAGFPGIPLAISNPQTKFTLLDSNRKKTEFLQKVIADLELKHTNTVWARGEEFLREHRFDAVLAQAVKPTRELLRLLTNVRRSFKELLLLKGKSWEKETSLSEEKQFGFERQEIQQFSLPGEKENRFLLCYRSR